MDLGPIAVSLPGPRAARGYREAISSFLNKNSSMDASARQALEADPFCPLALLMLLQGSPIDCSSLDLIRRLLSGSPFAFHGWLAAAWISAPEEEEYRQHLFRIAVTLAELESEGLETLLDMRSKLARRAGEAPFPASREALEAWRDAAEGDIGCEPPPLSAMLAPWRLLFELHRREGLDLPNDLTRRILAEPRCVPLLVAGLRHFGGRVCDSPGPETRARAAALLGELALPETLEALLIATTDDEFTVGVAATWASARVRNRHPAEYWEIIRKGASGEADISVRAIARQLWVHRREPGAREFMTRLLDYPADLDPQGFALAIAHAADALNDLDPHASRRSLREALNRCAPLIEPQDEEMVKSVVNGEARMNPVWATAEFFDLSLEEICDSDVLAKWVQPEEEDMSAGEGEEFDEPAAHFKLGRNDPCWCGSGKKYKKCHLDADEREARSSAPADNKGLARALLDFALERLPPEEVKSCLAEFGIAEIGGENEIDFDLCMHWMLYDRRSPLLGCTPAEEYLRIAKDLTPADRRLLQGWMASYAGIYEVTGVQVGRGVELQDVFEGATRFVHDKSTSRAAHRGDFILIRLERHADRWLALSSVLIIPPPARNMTIHWLEQEKGKTTLSWPALLKKLAPQVRARLFESAESWLRDLKIATSEGDPVEFCTVTWETSNDALVADELCRILETDRDEDGFAWTDKESKTLLGHLKLEGSRLTATLNSQNRLARLKRLLRPLVDAGLLRHIEDVVRPWRQALDEMPPAGERPEPLESIPPEIQFEIVGQALEKHYSTWPDIPLPALDGMTPRDAARNHAMRPRLERLLRDFESMSAHQRAEGRPAYDIRKLRKELGMD